MRYVNFDIEDFVKDDKFREWVLNSGPKINYFWEKWLLKHPDKEGIISEARNIVKSIEFEKHSISNENKKKLWNKIELSNSQTDQEKKEKINVRPLYHAGNNITGSTKRNDRRIYFGVAASVAIFAMALIIFFLNNQSLFEPHSGIIVKSNPAGQKSEFHLPDGTKVQLNAESTISYHENFENNSRKVTLTGEAFFEVNKDSLRPFIVYAGHLATTALGTSFNIQAFDDDSLRAVTLVTGKVKVEDIHSKQRIELNPGEGVSTYESAIIKKIKVDVKKALFWKEQIILFENTEFNEALHILERWYGVTFEISNRPGKMLTCSGKFINENLENVLHSLGFSIGFDYNINEREVKINFH